MPIFIGHQESVGFNEDSFGPITGDGRTNGIPLGDVQAKVLAPFSLTSISLVLEQAPTLGESFTVTLQKNGVDTALTVTVTGLAIANTNTVPPVTLGTGDLINYHYFTTGGNVAAIANVMMQ